MAQPTPSQIKNRLVTMCDAISGINTAVDTWPTDSQPFTAAELPAFVVNIGPATNGMQAGQLFSMSREFMLTLLAARFPADWKLTDNTTWEVIEPYMLSVPTYFAQHPRLEHNDSGLAVAITLPTERPIVAITFDGGLYAALPFTLQVRTLHT